MQHKPITSLKSIEEIRKEFRKAAEATYKSLNLEVSNLFDHLPEHDQETLLKIDKFLDELVKSNAISGREKSLLATGSLLYIQRQAEKQKQDDIARQEKAIEKQKEDYEKNKGFFSFLSKTPEFDKVTIPVQPNYITAIPTIIGNINKNMETLALVELEKHDLLPFKGISIYISQQQREDLVASAAIHDLKQQQQKSSFATILANGGLSQHDYLSAHEETNELEHTHIEDKKLRVFAEAKRTAIYSKEKIIDHINNGMTEYKEKVENGALRDQHRHTVENLHKIEKVHEQLTSLPREHMQTVAQRALFRDGIFPAINKVKPLSAQSPKAALNAETPSTTPTLARR